MIILKIVKLRWIECSDPLVVKLRGFFMKKRLPLKTASINSTCTARLPTSVVLPVAIISVATAAAATSVAAAVTAAAMTAS